MRELAFAPREGDTRAMLALIALAVLAQPVVHSQAELLDALSAGPTPLDAMSAEGRAQFVGQLAWNERGLVGLSTAVPLLELDADQITVLFGFIGAASYAPGLIAKVAGVPPLRLPGPTPRAAALRAEIARLTAAHAPSEPPPSEGLTQRDDEALSKWFRGVSKRSMAPASLRAASLGDLPIMMEVARSAFERTSDEASFKAVRAVYEEFKRRKIDTRRVFDASMLHCLLASQRFEEARAFALAHPRLQVRVPQVVDSLAVRAKGRTLLELDAEGTALTRRESGELELVMVIGTGCHYSIDALRDIAADPLLLATLNAHHLLVVTSPRDSISFDFVSEWNSAHPSMPIAIPFSAGEWKEIDVRAVPQFVIFRSGRARAVVSGWPSGGNARALRAALEPAAGE